MPLIKIYLSENQSDEYLNKVSEALHSALVETFLVPKQDCFQIVHRLSNKQRIYDANYACPDSKSRSEDWLLFDIRAGKPRDKNIKKTFYKALAKKLEQAVGLNPRDLMIIISTNHIDEWSFSDGLMAG